MEPAQKERALQIASLFATWLLVLPLAVSSCIYPWGRDQGIYAHSADRMLQGYALYSETYTFKPPMTAVVHAIALAIFGHSMSAIRYLDVFWTLATATVLWAIGRRMTGSGAVGAFAGAAFAWIIHRQSFWNSAQTDGWANLPMALAFLLVVTPDPDRSERQERIELAVAGAALMIAMLFKYSLLPFVLLLFAVEALRKGRDAGPNLATLAAGMLGVTALTALVMLPSGALRGFVETQIDVVLPYAGQTGKVDFGYEPTWDRFWKYFTYLGKPAIYAGLVGFFLLLVPLARHRTLHHPEVRQSLALMGWALVGLASGVGQRRFFPYQFLGIAGPMALLDAVAIVLPVIWLLRTYAPRAAIAGALVVPLVWWQVANDHPFTQRLAISQQVRAGRTTLKSYWHRSFHWKGRADNSLTDCMDVAAWLKRNTPEDAAIFLWTYDPMIYFLAERQQVSRFPYTFPLVVPWAPPELRDELMRDLEATPPVAFVVGSKDATQVVTGHKLDSKQTLARFPELKAFVDENYEQADEVGRFTVYLRKTTPE